MYCLLKACILYRVLDQSAAIAARFECTCVCVCVCALIV